RAHQLSLSIDLVVPFSGRLGSGRFWVGCLVHSRLRPALLTVRGSYPVAARGGPRQLRPWVAFFGPKCEPPCLIHDFRPQDLLEFALLKIAEVGRRILRSIEVIQIMSLVGICAQVEEAHADRPGMIGALVPVQFAKVDRVRIARRRIRAGILDLCEHIPAFVGIEPLRILLPPEEALTKFRRSGVAAGSEISVSKALPVLVAIATVRPWTLRSGRLGIRP